MELNLLPDQSVQWEHPITPDHTLRMVASDIRRERTGVHAKVTLYLDGVYLENDTFNLARREDRNRLAKDTHKMIGNGYDETYDLDDLTNDLGQFCELVPQVWEQDRFVVEHYDPTEEVPPVQFVLYPFILEGGGTIIFSPPGTGKSYAAQVMAVSIGVGLSLLFLVARPRPVLFLNLERSGMSVRRRFRWVCQALGITGEHKVDFIHARGQPFVALSRRVSRWKAEHPDGVAVVDSISRAGIGSLVEDETANRTIDWLSHHFDTWLAIGHTSKADKESLFGSIHFTCGEDIGVLLKSDQAEDGTLGIALEMVKSNDTAFSPIHYFALRFEGVGEHSHLVEIRRAKVNEFPGLIEGKAQTNVQKVIAFLNEMGKATATEIAAATGVPRSKASLLLGASNQFVRLPREGKRVYYGLAQDQGLPF